MLITCCFNTEAEEATSETIIINNEQTSESITFEPAINKPITTNRQNYLHDLAEMARKFGESEDSPIIQTLQEEWWKEQESLQILAKTVCGEAAICTWEHQCAVACVVVNRVNDPRFPNTVKEVVGQPKQYSLT